MRANKVRIKHVDDFSSIEKSIPKNIGVMKNVFLGDRQYPFLLLHEDFGVLVVMPIQYQQWKIPANCAAKIDFQEKNIEYRMTNPVSVLQEQCCYLSYWLQAAESKWFKKKIGFDVLPEVRGLFFMESIPGDGEIPAETDKIFPPNYCSLSKKTEWQEMIDQGSSSLVTFIADLSPVVSGAHEIRQEDLDRWSSKLAEKIVDVDIQDQWLDFRKEYAEEFKFDQILLSGFKIYEIEREISFKPITIMLGKNNSGKSTIIQALLLLKQSFENLRKGVPLKFHGPYWDLGNHKNCCYNKNIEIPIQFRLTFKNQLGQKRAFGFEFGSGENNQSVLKKLEYYESLTVNEIEKTESLSLDSLLYTFSLDDQSKKLVLNIINSEHPRWKAKISELNGQQKSEKTDKSISTENSSLTRMLTEGATQAVIEPKTFLPDEPKTSDPVFSDNPDYIKAYSVFFREFKELTETTRRLLDSIVYISPNRPYIKRFYSASNISGDELVWDMFTNDLARKKVVKLVNHWLKEFEIGYQIKKTAYNSLSGTNIVSPELVPINSHNGLLFAFSDVGQGLTHLLPVIVTLMAKIDSFIIIEDPEVHIHPRLQAALGDLFIESVKENRNFLLVESHSEHILDRLQLRIAEEKITNKEIALYYLKINQRPSRLKLDSYGVFQNEIPEEFFDAGIDDSEQQIGKILARKQKEMNEIKVEQPVVG